MGDFRLKAVTQDKTMNSKPPWCSLLICVIRVLSRGFHRCPINHDKRRPRGQANLGGSAGLKVYFSLWEHLCDQVSIFRRTAKILGAQLQILGAPTPKEYLPSKMSDSGFVLQYGPILAVLNTRKTNKRIRIFHTRVKLRY